MTSPRENTEQARQAVGQHIEWLRCHVRWQDDPPPASGLLDHLIEAAREEGRAEEREKKAFRIRIPPFAEGVLCRLDAAGHYVPIEGASHD